VKVILHQPQIPQNTGNIVRTCAATGASLALVTPLGFSTSNRRLRRAGLDYWEGVDVSFIDDLAAYLEKTEENFYFFSCHAHPLYTEVEFTLSDNLIFGSETSGLPEFFHKKWPERFFRIPMEKKARCLNLANSVSIVIYEAWRQNQFKTLNHPHDELV
jgi:tRNA (cytidine/uridine-2'-O-)-methyltransferase